MEKHQRGSGIIQVLLILVIAGFVGFVGWYIWHSKDNADISSNIQTEGNKAATDTTNQNTTSQTNPVTLKIDDYSLELKVPETLKDLAIGRSRTGTIEGKDFTESVLTTDKFPACEGRGGGVLGSVYKLNGKYDQYPIGVISDGGVYVKQLGSFYLMYQGPQSTNCGEGMPDATSEYAQVKQTVVDNGWVHKTK